MLDPIHNQGLKLDLGAFRTSPVASLYVEKRLGVNVQRILKISRVYTLAEILSNIFVKNRRKIGDLIYDHGLKINDFVPSKFLSKYIIRSLLARLQPLHSENSD